MSTSEDPDPSAPTLPFDAATLKVGAGAPTGGALAMAQQRSTRAPTAASESKGRKGERYRVERVLGAGGMGEVLLCRDTWLGRDVAKKFMHAFAGGDEARIRFLREARVQGQLEHPSVVPVYDIEWAEDGEPSFTMKRIQGKTLREVIESLAEGAPEALALHGRRRLLAALVSASQAVAFAHARGIVHRDIKPDNVMLGDFGEVYVLDWGIARTTAALDEPDDAAATAALAATQAGTLVGTPGYMAPEQALGEIDAISPRSDVYSLGCVLFEVLSFTPYHQEKNVAQLVADAVTKAPIAPSQVSPHLDIPPELDAIAMKALARDPADRYASARELALALERYLDGERNAELRRDLAQGHLTEAHEAFELAIRGGEGAETERARGMRELGRALALDPTNEAALQLITRVVMGPSEELPPDAERALRRVEHEDRRELAKQSVVSYLLWIPLVPLVFWMGIKDSGLAWAMGGSVTAVMLYALWMSATRNVGREFMRVAIVLNFVLIGVQSAVAGPLFIVPGAAALTASAFFISLRANRETQLLLAACAAGAIFLPLAAEWAGWLPPSYAFENGTIVLQPRLTYFPRTATWVFLTMIAAVQLAISLHVVSRAVRALKVAERTNFAQAYRLGQLLPPAKAS